jgi:arylsulfatase A-like enzyme
VDDMGLMDTSVPMLTNKEGKPQKHPLNDWYRTPNMERLAKQGVRFSQFYAQSVCSPTACIPDDWAEFRKASRHSIHQSGK